MVTVIVLVKADVGRIRAVAEAVAETEGVSAVYSVAGRYDLVVILEVRTLEDVESAVPGALDKVAGVTSSETLVAFRTYSSTELDAAFDIGVD